MKDNDLLVTELYKDPSNDSITAISVYLTPKTTSKFCVGPVMRTVLGIRLCVDIFGFESEVYTVETLGIVHIRFPVYQSSTVLHCI